jgi:branched-chain amino acid transport system permease protein
MDLVLQLFVNGIITGSHYALLAVGFGIIFATTRIVHFAYGPIFTVAAYMAWYSAAVLGLPLAVALLVAIFMAVLLGAGSYLLIYEPLERRQAPHLVPLIASLGLYIVLENLVGIVFGSACGWSSTTTAFISSGRCSSPRSTSGRSSCCWSWAPRSSPSCA